MVEAARIEGFAERVQIARRKVCQLAGWSVKSRCARCRWLGRNSPILKSHILGNQNPHSNVAKGATLEWGTLMTLGRPRRHEMCKLVTRW
jgi:hypothetical protein